MHIPQKPSFHSHLTFTELYRHRACHSQDQYQKHDSIHIFYVKIHNKRIFSRQIRSLRTVSQHLGFNSTSSFLQRYTLGGPENAQVIGPFNYLGFISSIPGSRTSWCTLAIWRLNQWKGECSLYLLFSHLSACFSLSSSLPRYEL